MCVHFLQVVVVLCTLLYSTPRMSGSKQKNSSDVAGTAKKHQAITMETKVKIIEKVEQGEKMVDTSCSCNMNHSSPGMILKNRSPAQVGCMRQVLGPVEKRMEEMEKLLSVRMQDQYQCCVLLSLVLIQEKAKSLYEDLKEKHGKDSESTFFNANHNWFHWFKAGANVHNVKVKIIDEGTYLLEQVFNVDEIELCWKRIPDGSHISKKENLMPDYKAVKDGLTLKSLLVYHSEKPRALKNKTKVVWKSNPKTWLEKYCLEEDSPFNVLLLLNNALGHPPPFMDDFHPRVNVAYLPQTLHSFSNLWTRESLQLSRNSIQVTLFCQPVKASDESGKILWRERVYSNLVTLSGIWRRMDLQEYDFIELLPMHHKELTNEDPRGLEVQWKNEERQEEEAMSRALSLFEEAKLVFEALDQNVEWYTKVAAAIQNAFQCYHVIYDKKKRSTTQTSQDCFFLRGR
ncbi:hypothetical protein FD754_008407 [Muntiacus muntjak]|uniref:DDE-1 domain-containing protein n=1 Tax=Muntiacus muntjak TaxID=9888 RepID=A0A5N3WRK3_MUNMU|nr:hypothetical protein FD754_008407 [Muntiacus muntjak]